MGVSAREQSIDRIRCYSNKERSLFWEFTDYPDFTSAAFTGDALINHCRKRGCRDGDSGQVASEAIAGKTRVGWSLWIARISCGDSPPGSPRIITKWTSVCLCV